MTDITIDISPQEINVSTTTSEISTSVVEQSVSITPIPNSISLSPSIQSINVEVADPDKIGATGATIESISVVEDTLTMSMTDGRELTAILTTTSLQKVVEIDFGSVGVQEKSFTIVDNSVTSSNNISAFQSGAAATGRDSDENEMDKLFVSAVANNGSFTIYASCYPNVVSGKYKINYIVS